MYNKEMLFFNYIDSGRKKEFKISLCSVYGIVDLFIKQQVIKSLPEIVTEEFKQNYNLSGITQNIRLEVIDTFDYEGERKRQIEEERLEQEYEEYIKKSCT